MRSSGAEGAVVGMHEENGRGPGGEPRRSAPGVGAQTFAEIQARSLEAAGALIDRVVRSIDGSGAYRAGPAATGRGGSSAAGSETAPTTHSSGPGEAPPETLTLLVEVWLELLRSAAEVVLPSGAEPTPPAGVPADAVAWSVPAGGSASPVRIEIADGGGTAEVWLHNGTPDSVGPLRVWCGPLLTAAGAELAGRLTIEPEQVPELPPRSSRGLLLTVVADRPAAPGTYRALLQASGGPELWLPLEVRVPEGP